MTEPIKTTDISLLDLIESDKKNRQYGKTDNIWIDDVSFYPDKNYSNLIIEYNSISMFCDINDKKIKLMDDENNIEIYYLKFKENDLMQIVFLSLKSGFYNHHRKKTLYDILEKTKIPVIKPNIKINTKNILIDTKNNYLIWMEKMKMRPHTTNPIKIDVHIKKLNKKLNDEVFETYELNDKEREIILKSLKNKMNG